MHGNESFSISSIKKNFKSLKAHFLLIITRIVLIATNRLSSGCLEKIARPEVVAFYSFLRRVFDVDSATQQHPDVELPRWKSKFVNRKTRTGAWRAETKKQTRNGEIDRSIKLMRHTFDPTDVQSTVSNSPVFQLCRIFFVRRLVD